MSALLPLLELRCPRDGAISEIFGHRLAHVIVSALCVIFRVTRCDRARLIKDLEPPDVQSIGICLLRLNNCPCLATTIYSCLAMGLNDSHNAASTSRMSYHSGNQGSGHHATVKDATRYTKSGDSEDESRFNQFVGDVDLPEGRLGCHVSR